MNESPIEQSIKEVIRNIFSCSGEPYSVSDTLVQILYKHLRLVANQYAQLLKTNLPKLVDFVHAFESRPMELLRIAKYFMIISTSKEITSATNCNNSINPIILGDSIPSEFETEDDQEQQPEDLDFMFIDTTNRKTGWLRFLDICTKAQIDLPTNQDLFELELEYTPNCLVRGRRLRLSRIDCKTASGSSEDYVTFARLRQSASLLKFVKRRLHMEFWRWLFNFQTTTESEIGLKNPDVREGVRIFAYLLTSHVWDVIDLALSRRQALKIDIRSPLTPIEIKESVRQLQKLATQTLKTL